jgi:hypothetical protein
MDALQLFEAMEFHDSGVDDFTWNASSGVLKLTIKLCNFMQDNYDEKKDPENTLGELVFTGVHDVICDPENALAPWGKETSREVLQFKATPVDEGRSRVTLVLSVTDFQPRTNDTHVIEFETDDVTWRPDSSLPG